MEDIDYLGHSVGLLLSLQVLLGLVLLLDAFEVRVWVVVHRVWELHIFHLGVSLVLPLGLLLILWGGWMVKEKRISHIGLLFLSVIFYPVWGLEVALSVASIIAGGVGLWFWRRYDRFLFWVFGILGSFEMVALFHWVFFVPLGLWSPFEYAARMDLDLFHLLSFFGPYLAMIMVFLCVFGLFEAPFSGKGFSWRARTHDQGRESLSTNQLLVIVGLLFVGVVVAFYPYTSYVNEGGINVGEDIQHYIEDAVLVEGDILRSINVWDGSRPLIFVVIYMFQKSLGLNVVTAVRFMHILLNPLLGLSVFFFTYVLLREFQVSFLACLFTLFGFPVIVGMYAGYLANMLGLSAMFLSLGFLFRGLDEGGYRDVFIATLFGSLLVFTHPWTFDQYFAALVLTMLFLSYYVKTGGIGFDYVVKMFSYIVMLGFVDIFKVLVFRGYGAASASSAVLSMLTNVSLFWYHVDFTYRTLFNGLLSTIPMLILILFGVMSLEFNSIAEIFLQFLLGVSSAGFLIGNDVIKSRLVLNLPMGFLGAIGFFFIYQRIRDRDLRISFVFFLGAYLATFVFRSLANMV